MELNKSSALENALENQIRRLKKKVGKLEKLSSRISAIRFFDFVLAIVLVFLAARSGSTWLFGAILTAGVGTFVALVSYHRKIDRAIKRFNGWIKIREHHLARMSLDWDNIPELKTQKNYDSHPFARDFDLTGQHSLLQLMDTATYPGSSNLLEQWMLKREPQLSAITDRQELVRELKPMAHFRDRLHLYADVSNKQSSKFDWTMDQLLLFVQSTQQKNFTTPLVILGSLAASNIILLTLYLTGVLGPYVFFTFVAYMIAYNSYSEKISGLFEEANQLKKLLSRFRQVLLYLESYPYKKESSLYDFTGVFHQGDKKPSGYLKKIVRIASAASSQNSELVWVLINLIVPWDMYFAKKLNSYKQDLAPKLEQWLDRFYQLEALNSIANFAWLNPEYTFALPEQNRDDSIFKAQKLGHPLIRKSKKVTNDVTIDTVGDIQLITGSNMAGKSTYLRTVGINLCLCFAGAPVNASSFNTIPFRLFSSINVTDSLDEGLSHFYAEVKRLRTLLNQLQQPHDLPLFFMVDEIYRGTNNRERLIGSKAFLKHVAGKDGIGLVSTHDLELAQLEDEISTLSNWHFEETIEDGKMRFEYKLKPGPCPSTNALKIMQMEDLPV